VQPTLLSESTPPPLRTSPPDRELPPEQDHGGAKVWPMGSPDRPRTPWPWWYGPVGLVAGVAASIGTVLLVFGLLGVSVGEPYAELIVIGSLMGVVALLARRRGPLSPRLFGLRPTPARAAVGWVVVTYVMQLIVMGIWLSTVHVHYTNVPRGPFGHLAGGSIGLIIAVAVIAPIGEEIVFRGFLYGALRTRLGTGSAATIAGVMFGCGHFTTAADSWQIVPPLAFFGIAQCLLYERTGSILPCIATHMLMNGVVIGVATRTIGPIALVLLAAGLLFLLAPWRFVRRPRRERTAVRVGAAPAR
jgi:membrane protease YdiL (CAAX protease family)